MFKWEGEDRDSRYIPAEELQVVHIPRRAYAWAFAATFALAVLLVSLPWVVVLLDQMTEAWR